VVIRQDDVEELSAVELDVPTAFGLARRYVRPGVQPATNSRPTDETTGLQSTLYALAVTANPCATPMIQHAVGPLETASQAVDPEQAQVLNRDARSAGQVQRRLRVRSH
jgi:hypothetical protein